MRKHKIKEMYDFLKKIPKSNQSIFEILFTYHNLKGATRLTASEKELRNLKCFCEKYNLFMATSGFKLKLFPKNDKKGYSDRAKKIPLESSEGKYVVYISNSKKKVLLAKRYESNGEHRKFGEILGYPKCCVESFMKNLKKQSGKSMDFVLPALGDELKYKPFMNNIAIRYFGIEVLGYFPCSFECEESKKIGEKYLKVIKAYDPQLAERYERELKSFVLYTEYDGVFYSPDYSFDGKVVTYNNLKSTLKKGKLYEALNENNKIRCNSKNSFEINGEHFEDENYGIMLFK